MAAHTVRPRARPSGSNRLGQPPSSPVRSSRSPWAWVLTAAAVAVAGAAAVPPPAAAHSFLTHPLPAWEAVAGCRVGGTPGFMYNCKGPCPNAGGYPMRDGLDEEHPTAVWARGESVEVRWARYVLSVAGGGNVLDCVCHNGSVLGVTSASEGRVSWPVGCATVLLCL